MRSWPEIKEPSDTRHSRQRIGGQEKAMSKSSEIPSKASETIVPAEIESRALAREIELLRQAVKLLAMEVQRMRAEVGR
jgi:hypothetical protein